MDPSHSITIAITMTCLHWLAVLIKQQGIKQAMYPYHPYVVPGALIAPLYPSLMLQKQALDNVHLSRKVVELARENVKLRERIITMGTQVSGAGKTAGSANVITTTSRKNKQKYKSELFDGDMGYAKQARQDRNRNLEQQNKEETKRVHIRKTNENKDKDNAHSQQQNKAQLNRMYSFGYLPKHSLKPSTNPSKPRNPYKSGPKKYNYLKPDQHSPSPSSFPGQPMTSSKPPKPMSSSVSSILSAPRPRKTTLIQTLSEQQMQKHNPEASPPQYPPHARSRGQYREDIQPIVHVVSEHCGDSEHRKHQQENQQQHQYEHEHEQKQAPKRTNQVYLDNCTSPWQESAIQKLKKIKKLNQHMPHAETNPATQNRRSCSQTRKTYISLIANVMRQSKGEAKKQDKPVTNQNRQ